MHQLVQKYSIKENLVEEKSFERTSYIDAPLKQQNNFKHTL